MREREREREIEKSRLRILLLLLHIIHVKCILKFPSDQHATAYDDLQKANQEEEKEEENHKVKKDI